MVVRQSDTSTGRVLPGVVEGPRRARAGVTLAKLPAVSPRRRIELPAVSRRKAGGFTLAKLPAVSRRKAGGFTLVELLVVVGIIALLITILMPALNRAMAYTRMVMCQNNHNVLTKATRLYTADWDEILPFSNWLSQEDHRGNWDGPGWLYKYPDMDELEHLEKGSLWQYINAHGAYRCPADKPPWKGRTNAITSYMMNGAVTGFGRQMP
ncbi:hypothetical protein LCGC14_1959100, partial [marine sediment metagenome]